MPSKTPFRRAFPGVVAIVALAALAAPTVATAELVLRPSADYCAEVDGAYAPDARFFTTDSKGRLLVDIPSLSVSVLLNVKAGKAVAVQPSSIQHETADSRVRLVDPLPSDAPAYKLSIEGTVTRFRIDTSELRIRKASDCRPVAVPGWTIGPVTDDSSARKCLHLENKPIAPTAGCTKAASLKNSCDVPVLAVVRRTQHLFSGSLPETSSIVIPPGVEHPLGCAWSLGAAAPEVSELLAAAFLPRRSRPDDASTGP